MSPDIVIKATLPTGAAQRNDHLMLLARGLKFNAGMAGADAAQLKPIVREWHRRALPVLGTKEFELTLCEFYRAFSRATHPLGLDLVDQAAAQIDPDDLCEAALRYEGQSMRKLVSLCHELSRVNTGRLFFLSCHDAAPRIGVTSMQAWRLFRMLEDDKVIQLIERGFKTRTGGRATRYRWIGKVPT